MKEMLQAVALTATEKYSNIHKATKITNNPAGILRYKKAGISI